MIEAIQRLIDAGGPLAAKGMTFWFWLRLMDNVIGLIETAAFLGLLFWAIKTWAAHVKWYRSSPEVKRESNW